MRRHWLPVMTGAYLAVLVATTLTQHAVASSTRSRLLTGSSTDVAHLVHDPLLVLVASAFWLPDTTSLVLLPLVIVVLALGERRVGAARTAVAFVAGHLVATLLTQGTVWVGVHGGWLAASHEHRLDVGPSYGACAVLGLLVTTMPAAPRNYGYAALAVLLGVPLVFDSEVTTVGHVLAAATGLALWLVPWIRRSRGGRAQRPAPCPRDCSFVSRC
jgi:hypothetical protein